MRGLKRQRSEKRSSALQIEAAPCDMKDAHAGSQFQATPIITTMTTRAAIDQCAGTPLRARSCPRRCQRLPCAGIPRRSAGTLLRTGGNAPSCCASRMPRRIPRKPRRRPRRSWLRIRWPATCKRRPAGRSPRSRYRGRCSGPSPACLFRAGRMPRNDRRPPHRRFDAGLELTVGHPLPMQVAVPAEPWRP